MHRDNSTQLRKAAGILSGVLLLLAAAVAAFLIIAEQPLELVAGRRGIEFTWDLLRIPITLGVAAFAVFATWLTLRRIEQTDMNLELTIQRNNFDNFYKHLDEFIRHLSEDTLVQYFHKLTEVEYRTALSSCYRQYYADNFQVFDPSLNQITRKAFEDFHRTLVSLVSDRDVTTFDELPLTGLRHCESLVDAFTREFANPLVARHESTLRKLLASRKLPPSEIEDIVTRFSLVDTIYWANSFQTNVLAFDGRILQPPLSLSPKYSQYMSSLGFSSAEPA